MANALLSTIKQVPISELKEHPRNARRGNIDEIANSLQANGQFRPILVQRSTNVVIAGHHTVAAARQLGWDKIAVSYVDVDDEAATRIMLADNRTSDLASYDEGSLAELLRGLDTYDGTGYSEDYVGKLFERFDPVVPIGENGAEGADAGSDDGSEEAEPPDDDIVRNWIGHFQLVFDTEEQRLLWNSFIRWLRVQYPDADTNTERIVNFIRANTPEADVHQ